MTLRLTRNPTENGPDLYRPDAVWFELLIQAPDPMVVMKLNGAIIDERLNEWLCYCALDGNAHRHTNVRQGFVRIHIWVLERFADRVERDFTLLQIAGPEALKTLF